MAYLLRDETHPEDNYEMFTQKGSHWFSSLDIAMGESGASRGPPVQSIALFRPPGKSHIRASPTRSYDSVFLAKSPDVS